MLKRTRPTLDARPFWGRIHHCCNFENHEHQTRTYDLFYGLHHFEYYMYETTDMYDS